MTFNCKWCGRAQKHDRRVCSMKSSWQTPEFRERQAEAMRKKWQDQEFRERQAEAVRAPLQQRWRDPEFRERHARAMAKTVCADLDRLNQEGLETYHSARADGFGARDAFEIAIDAMQQDGAMADVKWTLSGGKGGRGNYGHYRLIKGLGHE